MTQTAQNINLAKTQMAQHAAWLNKHILDISYNQRSKTANSLGSFFMWNYVYDPQNMIKVFNILERSKELDMEEEDKKLFELALDCVEKQSADDYRSFLYTPFLKKSFKAAMVIMVDLMKYNIKEIRKHAEQENTV